MSIYGCNWSYPTNNFGERIDDLRALLEGELPPTVHGLTREQPGNHDMVIEFIEGEKPVPALSLRPILLPEGLVKCAHFKPVAPKTDPDVDQAVPADAILVPSRTRNKRLTDRH